MLLTRPLSLIDVTILHLVEARVTKVGLLASPSSIKTRLFDAPIRSNGMAVVLPSSRLQHRTEKCIRGVIKGVEPETELPALIAVIDHLESRGAGKVVLGCTELSVIADGFKSALIVDPLDLIVDEILCKGVKNANS